jgi:hypothetical protein
MAFSGVVKAKLDTDKMAIVTQTAAGATYADGYRRVVADVSAKAVGVTISYNYSTDPSVESDTITIL